MSEAVDKDLSHRRHFYAVALRSHRSIDDRRLSALLVPAKPFKSLERKADVAGTRFFAIETTDVFGGEEAQAPFRTEQTRNGRPLNRYDFFVTRARIGKAEGL